MLKKVTDKYNRDRISIPANFEDLRAFEENNAESVFVFALNSKEEIYKFRNGNSDYLLAIPGKIKNLLYVEDGKKAHYICIKHLAVLFDLISHAANRDKRHCPFCNRKYRRIRLTT